MRRSSQWLQQDKSIVTYRTKRATVPARSTRSKAGKMSSKKEQREARRQAKRQVRCKCRGAGCERCDPAEFVVTPVEIVRRAKVVVAPLEPRTEAQKRYIAAMKTFPL